MAVHQKSVEALGHGAPTGDKLFGALVESPEGVVRFWYRGNPLMIGDQIAGTADTLAEVAAVSPSANGDWLLTEFHRQRRPSK